MLSSGSSQALLLYCDAFFLLFLPIDCLIVVIAVQCLASFAGFFL
uniref:Uncharacterized protein n=1 Tax=Rhizophora mucronata TaxID=61149 RepID=A0A2P2N7T5_RHIMU